MAKRDERNERKARVTGDEEYASSANWINQNKRAGEKLAFSVPEGLPVVKLEKDKIYRFSFIPYRVGKRCPNPGAAPGKLFWIRSYMNHPRIGPNKDTFLCLANSFKEPCPACAISERLFKTPLAQMSPADKELQKALKPKKRTMALVFDHDHPEKGLQFFEDSYFSFGETFTNKLKQRQGRPEYQKLDHHWVQKGGCIVQLGTTAKDIGGRDWIYVNDIEFHKIEKPVPLEIFKKAEGICLDDLIADNKPNVSEFKKMVTTGDEVVEDEEEDNEDEEAGDEVDEETEEADDEDNESGSEDDGEDEEEESEEEEPAIAKGDTVTFLRKGVRTTAKVIAVKGEQAKVKTKSGDEIIKALDDLTPVKVKPKDDEEEEQEEEFEEETEEEEVKTKPKPKPKADKKPKPKPKADDDEEEDDGFSW